MKWHNLKKGDKFKDEDGEVYEFIKPDGAYGQWKNDEGEYIVMAINGELQKQGDYFIIKEND